MRLVLLLLSVFALFEPRVVPRTESPKRDELVLIDGRYLHYKRLSDTDAGIQVVLLDTGGQVFIPWGLIDEPWRTKIMNDCGRGQVEAKVFLEPGERVTSKMGESWDGRVTSETAEEVTLMHQGSELKLPKAQVRSVEKMQVNVLEIYKPEQYYNKRAGELKVPDDDIPGNMELGQLAMDLDLFDKAQTHYKRVQATDPGYEKDKIDNILKRIEELSKNQKIRDALHDANRNMQINQFAKALAQYDILLALKELPPTLKGEVQLWKDKCIKARYEYFRLEVRAGYEGKLREKIATKARKEDVKLAEAQKWLRVDLHKEVVADLATQLGIDGKEVEKMWEERGFNTPRNASYGSGSFIVLGKAPDADKYEQELTKALQQSQQQKQGGSGKSSKSGSQNNAFQSNQDKLPKAPTKDEWWSKVSTSSDREQWMRAFWAENAKRVTVIGRKWEDCSRCGGTGALKFDGPQGDTLRTTCPSCQGHKRYLGVAYK